MFIYFTLLLAVFSNFQHFAQSTLTPNSRKSDSSKFAKVKTGPQSSSVFDRNLVTETTNIREILQNYKAYFKEVDNYDFDGLVLGYVTPVLYLFFGE